MPVSAIPNFERFFRIEGGLDVDKDDLKRYRDFIGGKIHDLLVVAEATAKANIRDVIEPWDLPITKGLQERIHEFEKIDEDVELEPILEQLATWPQLDLALSDETQAGLPAVAGGLSVALAHLFTIIDPTVKNPSTAHWERAFRTFRLLL
ncbi:MAG: hypothetical protein JWO37_1712 [Acidimicrobiales bacterium]|jgi:hypothetical protein|nr:hypothetical protein [Acidimicrobiales bacterium]